MEDRQRPKPTGTNRPTQTHTPTPPTHTPRIGGAGQEGAHHTPHTPGGPRTEHEPASTMQTTTNPPPPPNKRRPGPEDHNHPQPTPQSSTRTTHPTTRLGGHSGEATPGPIPNPEAKTPSANGTAPARTRKSRTPPSTHHPPTTHKNGGGALCINPVPPPHDGGLVDAAVDSPDPPVEIQARALFGEPLRNRALPPLAQIHEGSSMCQCQKV